MILRKYKMDVVLNLMFIILVFLQIINDDRLILINN